MANLVKLTLGRRVINRGRVASGDGEDKLLGILIKYTHREVKITMSLGNYGVGCWEKNG